MATATWAVVRGEPRAREAAVGDLVVPTAADSDRAARVERDKRS